MAYFVPLAIAKTDRKGQFNIRNGIYFRNGTASLFALG